MCQRPKQCGLACRVYDSKVCYSRVYYGSVCYNRVHYGGVYCGAGYITAGYIQHGLLRQDVLQQGILWQRKLPQSTLWPWPDTCEVKITFDYCVEGSRPSTTYIPLAFSKHIICQQGKQMIYVYMYMFITKRTYIHIWVVK